MKVRKAHKKDLGTISEIFRRETAKRPYVQKWTKKTALEKIRLAFKNDDCYVAILNDSVAGFIICKKDKKKSQVYVDELWLKANVQRRGMGTQIMNHVERLYKKRGFHTITLMANRKSKAVDFYKKLKYDVKHEFLYMTKRLT